MSKYNIGHKIRQRRAAIADLLADVAIELRARMARTILMMAAVALSTGALLASVGISQNAAHQVDADIAASTIDQILLTKADGTGDGPGGDADRASRGPDGQKVETYFYPADAKERLLKIDTVAAVGRRSNLLDAIHPTITRPITHDEINTISIIGAEASYLDAANVDKPTQAWMLDQAYDVVFLGESAAEKLDIPVTSDTRGLKVLVDGLAYSVAGFLPGETLENHIVLPLKTAFHLAGGDKQTDILIRTKIGAGSQVSNVARLALMPNQPEKLSVSQVVSVESIRENVSGQLAQQAAWVGAFLIVLTVLLIANSMIVSVTARTTEIGVRRALGSSRGRVAAVFWVEGAVTGALGGLVGSAVASVIIVGVSAVSGWTALLNIGWIMLGPVLGAAVGVVASAYPAARASMIHPAIAVRSN
ncbi:ABC transporter permease [Arcanobacterium pinnipediorum]|uniref:ABC transporter permease n=1 Tax=Arcanobacterium pinnipediorum TaxID=1503041 RepID=A0ABY5AIF7_9ACTO|nr:ABC transporter permease [Arcanobacterium pinnipediorum]USR79983.1 ABC transporter permease [Arcanobacterium pinnipediorum]